MKLLFDQNLSHKLARTIRGIFPGSTQVGLLQMDRTADQVIWEYARTNDYVLVTHDADFVHLNNMRGYPPKVIWLRCGNQPTRVIEHLLRSNHVLIIQFLNDPKTGCLKLG